jgi:hypothetical protein
VVIQVMTTTQTERRAALTRRRGVGLDSGGAPAVLASLVTALDRLPGGRLDERPGHVRHGRVQPPGLPACEVTVRALDVDEDAGSAGFDFRAREAGGPATVSGALRAQAASDSELALEAEFRWIGIDAPVETVERVADALLGDLCAAVEALATDASDGGERATAEPRRRAVPRGPAAAVAAGAALAAAAAALGTSRRRRCTSIWITYRW